MTAKHRPYLNAKPLPELAKLEQVFLRDMLATAALAFRIRREMTPAYRRTVAPSDNPQVRA